MVGNNKFIKFIVDYNVYIMFGFTLALTIGSYNMGINNGKIIQCEDFNGIMAIIDNDGSPYSYCIIDRETIEQHQYSIIQNWKSNPLNSSIDFRGVINE